MKALAVIVILVVLISAGCGDSTNDVLVARDDTSIPPDTVVIKDELLMEFYLADNARSIESEAAAAAKEGVQIAIDRLTEAGCVRDESGNAFIRVTDPDGRTMEATWLAFVDPSDDGATTGVVHAHIDGTEYVVPLHAVDVGGTDKSGGECWVKSASGEWGPSLNLRTLFNNCASFIAGLFQVCVGQCTMGGVPLSACQKACMVSVGAAYLACIFFSIVG